MERVKLDAVVRIANLVAILNNDQAILHDKVDAVGKLESEVSALAVPSESPFKYPVSCRITIADAYLAGPNKIPVIKDIREFTGTGLAEAKAISEGRPFSLPTPLHRELFDQRMGKYGYRCSL